MKDDKQTPHCFLCGAGYDEASSPCSTKPIERDQSVELDLTLNLAEVA